MKRPALVTVRRRGDDHIIHVPSAEYRLRGASALEWARHSGPHERSHALITFLLRRDLDALPTKEQFATESAISLYRMLVPRVCPPIDTRMFIAQLVHENAKALLGVVLDAMVELRDKGHIYLLSPRTIMRWLSFQGLLDLRHHRELSDSAKQCLQGCFDMVFPGYDDGIHLACEQDAAVIRSHGRIYDCFLITGNPACPNPNDRGGEYFLAQAMSSLLKSSDDDGQRNPFFARLWRGVRSRFATAALIVFSSFAFVVGFVLLVLANAPAHHPAANPAPTSAKPAVRGGAGHVNALPGSFQLPAAH